MAKSVYQVWLDDDKMRLRRPAYQRAKDRNQLIIYGIFALYLVIFLVSILAGFATLLSLSYIGTAYLFLLVASLLGVFSADKMGIFFDQRLPDFLRRHSTACCDWTQQHKAKAFGEYFVKRAVAADIPVAEANEAMARFLAKGNICYEAFDAYCGQKQTLVEQQAAAAAAAEKHRKEQESYQKNLDRLNKKFAPSDADAQS